MFVSIISIEISIILKALLSVIKVLLHLILFTTFVGVEAVWDENYTAAIGQEWASCNWTTDLQSVVVQYWHMIC